MMKIQNKRTKKYNSDVIITKEQINERIDSGITVAQIAREYGVSRQAVHQRINKEDYKQRLMYKRHYEIIFLYKIGFLPNEIEDMLKVGEVYYILNQYKIKRPLSPKNPRCCRWEYNVN